MLRPDERSVSLYGFDARRALGGEADAWPDERRELYLLDPSVRQPLSVDAAVWSRALPDGVTDGAAPDYWADLSALRSACVEHGLAPPAVTLVGLGVVADVAEAMALLVPVAPATTADEWVTLGWDVADNGLTSGLSNCGYTPAERQELSARYGSSLNAHGLFDDHEAAIAFAALSDERVPEHAPFLVHCLFQIPTP